MKARNLSFIVIAIIALTGFIFTGCTKDLGGLPSPVALSGEEYVRVMEIARDTEEARQWLEEEQGCKIDYRWLAIKWNDSGEFSAFRSIDYKWENDPNYALVTGDYLWYPALVMTFGDPAEWQVTAAVDLELGKAVYVMENPVRTGPQPQPEPEIEIRPAPIHEVRVNIAESFPPQIFLYIQGGLSDGCTTFHGIEVERSGNVIDVKVNVQRPVDTVCPAVYTYFERNEALGTDFVAGEEYTINVNDYTTSFVMQ